MEPSTSAKVILHTTKGPIDIELWAKECPLTSRNFLQHCLDGYYNGCEFHRIVPDYIIQSGDPTNSGFGGESIYESPYFKDEFHSRLRFNKRGILASANIGEPNTNGSQFLITLKQAPELNGKHTIFGRVIGESFYNVLQIADTELDTDTEKPLYPTAITKTEVVIPYFDDLRQTPLAKAEVSVEKTKTPRSVPQKQRKVAIRYNSEDEDDEAINFKLAPQKKKKKLHEPALEEKAQKEIAPIHEEPPIPSFQTSEEAQENQPSEEQPKAITKEEREAETLKMLGTFQSKISTTIDLPSDDDEEEPQDED